MAELFSVIDEEWDADKAVESLRKWASKNNTGLKEDMDWEKYSEGFFWVDKKDKENFTSYKLPFLAVKDGGPHAVKKAIAAVRGALSGARGGVDIPKEEQEKIMKKVEQYEKKIEKEIGYVKKELESKLRFIKESGLPNDFRLELVKLDNDQISVGNVGIWLTVEIPGLSKVEEAVYNSLKSLIEDSVGLVTDFAGDQLTIKVEDKTSGQRIANETVNALKEIFQTFESELVNVQTATA